MDEKIRPILSILLCCLVAPLLTAGLRQQDGNQFLLLSLAALTAIGGLVAAIGVENAREARSRLTLAPDHAQIDQNCLRLC
jgi:hypothetical protein